MDVNQIVKLIDKLDTTSLTEISFEDGTTRLHLKKGVTQPVEIISQPNCGADNKTLQTAGASSAGSESATAGYGCDVITSPLVGTFYRAPSPDAPPFVEAGGSVNNGDRLCILEAMKMMNELEAEYACRIVKVLVENGAMVEFGTPLFEVERA